ncbi:hypothetical protein HMPREF9081_1897 [Centipeda periodontii DSM 2778]|uniref:Uncharacterized protein n=1 Tax=Centipeda periodontii DSM 2778 TaxID=888060 RepID=F5RNS6_9FIRM|nr:hypothetical protein HMPREF9081_1897 [Centipeda periodontii DSM 2778]
MSFNPRAPCGARPPMFPAVVPTHQFQSTRPVRGATSAFSSAVIDRLFQSTRPVRGATHYKRRMKARASFQSTRPVRGATGQLSRRRPPYRVSIHAPRAGRDTAAQRFALTVWGFNPRAPCGARPLG